MGVQSCIKFLPDYAKEGTNGGLLNKVGINGIKIYREDFNEERVITSQSAYISLKDMKGIHMSRLVAILLEHKDHVLELDDELMDALSSSHRSKFTYWECEWQSLMDSDDAQQLLVDMKIEGKKINQVITWYLTVGVPYASVCPCSAEMCKEVNEGIPHMQRAIAIVTGELDHTVDLSNFSTAVISKIIGTVDLIPVPYMKRVDELQWCMRAAKKNLFVEDAAREISSELSPWFKNFVVVCKHFESIHQHEVVAVKRNGKGIY